MTTQPTQPAQPIQPTAKALALVLTLVGLFEGVRATVAQILASQYPLDMVIYREGVRAFLEGRAMYSEPMPAGDIALPFIYPPFGALVMVPLSGQGLSHDAAGNIMIVLSNLLLFLCLWLIVRALSAPLGTQAWYTHFSRQWVWAAAALAWGVVCNIEPVRLNNSFAQINMVIMALVVLDLVPRKRTLPQGWLIGVAAAIKLSPLAMLLYFLLRKDFKAIVTAGVSAVIATAIAALVRWDATWEFFSVKLLSMGGGGEIGVNTSYQSNSSIKAVIQRAFGSQEVLDASSTLVNVLWLVLALATIAAGSWLMLRLIRQDLYIEAWLVGSMVMLLISPISWSHHWVWLALILPVFLYRAYQWRPYTSWANVLLGVLVVWLVLVLAVPPKWWFGDSIDIFAKAFWVKFLVSDFVWFAAATFALLGVCLSKLPTPPAPKQSSAS